MGNAIYQDLGALTSLLSGSRAFSRGCVFLIFFRVCNGSTIVIRCLTRSMRLFPRRFCVSYHFSAFRRYLPQVFDQRFYLRLLVFFVMARSFFYMGPF